MNDLERLSVDAVRVLSMDAVQRANTGSYSRLAKPIQPVAASVGSSVKPKVSVVCVDDHRSAP